jgi:hypothetical protein
VPLPPSVALCQILLSRTQIFREDGCHVAKSDRLRITLAALGTVIDAWDNL